MTENNNDANTEAEPKDEKSEAGAEKSAATTSEQPTAPKSEAVKSTGKGVNYSLGPKFDVLKSLTDANIGKASIDTVTPGNFRLKDVRTGINNVEKGMVLALMKFEAPIVGAQGEPGKEATTVYGDVNPAGAWIVKVEAVNGVEKEGQWTYSEIRGQTIKIVSFDDGNKEIVKLQEETQKEPAAVS